MKKISAVLLAIIFSFGLASTSHAAGPNVWWPVDNVNLDGTQPFKAVLDGKNVYEYQMHWQVDNGNPVWMYDSYVDYPHKEAMVDLSNWNWSESASYNLTFIAKDWNGNEIGRKQVVIKHGTPKVQNNLPTNPTAPIDVKPAIETARLDTQVLENNAKLFVDQNNPASAQAKEWQNSRPQESSVMKKIGETPMAIWLGGWNSDVKSDVMKNIEASKKTDSIPVFVAYNIPGRDCGLYSAGGLSSKETYLSWIREISSGIESGKAMIILEPDALAGIDCLSDSGKADRYAMISEALDIFKTNNANAKVYIDAGNPGWIDASVMAERLKKAGIDKSAGFSLNVSNFFTTAENEAHGNKISALTGNSSFVIDVSRNGNGSKGGEWCNPSGMALGQTPTLTTGKPHVDALLWIKTPGQSDGNCNGAPASGGWWPEYLLGLAKSAGWY